MSSLPSRLYKLDIEKYETMGEGKYICVKGMFGGWLPYMKSDHGEYYVLMGTFVKQSDADIWVTGKEVEVYT